MHPEICKIGPFTIYSYGLMLVIAFSAASFLARTRARQEGINPEIISNFCFCVFIFGIIGSRIFYILENSALYFQNPREIFMLQHGGLSWFGGLLLGSISAVVYLKIKKAPLLRTLDLIAPFIALAQAIGRIGCWLNGCCFAKPGLAVPSQVVSSFLLVIIFITLRLLQDKPHRPGRIFFLYLLFYSVKRFGVEFLRADNPVVFMGLTLFQFLSIALFVFALTGIFLAKGKK